MYKKLTKHLPHYISLIGILAAGLFGFILFSYDRGFQAEITLAVASAYIVWGVLHHLVHKDLYWEVVIEYFVFAILGVVIIFSLIFRV